MKRPYLSFFLGLLSACAKDPSDSTPTCDDAALSSCLSPTQSDSYYVDQGNRYFDTLDASADPESVPAYADWVARWEWPPWLLLTGYGSDLTLAVDRLVLAAYPTTTVPTRDCRFFDTQPFARCHVVMDYDGKDCPIYEEFTFNDEGNVTFVEAWSDPNREWSDQDGAQRLSTRIPGLGSPTGYFDPQSEAMTQAAAQDADVADFVMRTQDFWTAWSAAYDAAGDDLFARGCGW